MSENEPDGEFWEIADSFIGFANQCCDKHPRGKVSAGFLYAVARFNTFVVASLAKDKEAFMGDREKVVSYFTGQFEKMLRDNLEDYTRHFEKYVSER